MMTSRERVLCALNHEEPDRVPIFFGTSGATTVLAPAYERLKTYFGIKEETKFISRIFQYAEIDEKILLQFGSDGRPLLPGPVALPLSKEISEEGFVDVWGITWRMKPGTIYYEAVKEPLRDAAVDDLNKYPWPDLAQPGRFKGLAEEARGIRDRGYAVVALSGISVFEQIFLLRGMDGWLLDLAGDPDFSHALLRKVTDIMLSGALKLLGEAGEWIDVLVMGDDLGTQNSPLISPKMYRDMIKPYHAEIISAIKKKTKAKIFYHSDGNIYPLINDLIEIGVDILNPVQVSAKEMGDTLRLKREFGDRVSFNGAIDTQWVLPHGTSEDVRMEVRKRICDLGRGGGYICSAVHCIQPDVPTENICAMFEEAAKAGGYPL